MEGGRIFANGVEARQHFTMNRVHLRDEKCNTACLNSEPPSHCHWKSTSTWSRQLDLWPPITFGILSSTKGNFVLIWWRAKLSLNDSKYTTKIFKDTHIVNACSFLSTLCFGFVTGLCDLKFTIQTRMALNSDPPASTSWVLGSQACNSILDWCSSQDQAPGFVHLDQHFPRWATLPVQRFAFYSTHWFSSL